MIKMHGALSLIVMLFAAGTVLAQAGGTAAPDTLLVLKNGAEVRGTFSEMKEGEYFLHLPDGRTMGYPASDVARMERLNADASAPPTQVERQPTVTQRSICRIFITEQVLDENLYVPIKDVAMAKKGYGSVRDAYEALASEARKLDADAVIGARKWFAPSGFSHAAPKAKGMAVRWTEAGRQAFPTFVGRCY